MRPLFIAVTTAAVSFAATAHAVVIEAYYDRADFAAATSPTRVETFNAITEDTSFVDKTLSFGGVSIIAENVNHGTLDAAPFSSVNFVVDQSPYALVSLQSANDVFRIVFDTPVQSFAADFSSLNARGGTNRDTAFSVLGQSIALPTVTRVGDNSFFGIVSDTAFTEVEFTRSGRDSAFGIDNVQFAPVPVPAAGLLLGGVLVAGGVWSRRARAGKAD
ncbi:MAG: hypothetical protein AAGF71_13580 [Pseudomonadota bacterium]